VADKGTDVLDLVPKRREDGKCGDKGCSSAQGLSRTEDERRGCDEAKRENIKGYVLDHRRPLKTQTPSEDAHVGRDAHRLQHLWTEHARVPDLDRLVELSMILEDLE
jgi:hypothetical protein